VSDAIARAREAARQRLADPETNPAVRQMLEEDLAGLESALERQAADEAAAIAQNLYTRARAPAAGPRREVSRLEVQRVEPPPEVAADPDAAEVLAYLDPRLTLVALALKATGRPGTLRDWDAVADQLERGAEAAGLTDEAMVWLPPLAHLFYTDAMAAQRAQQAVLLWRELRFDAGKLLSVGRLPGLFSGYPDLEALLGTGE
jgi:hypothetical protein